jgi:DNA-binding response OmpR family regulator
MRILLIEDHQRLAESIISGLSGLGFGVDFFMTAAEGHAAMKSIAYDAMILDLGLPDRDGLDFIRELRAETNRIPVLVLTARDGIDDRVEGLDSGADDYLLKPFAMRELAARLRALLRRPGRQLVATLNIGNVTLHAASRQLKVGGRIVAIPPRELDGLELLMRRADQVVPKRLFEDSVYGLSADVSPNTIEALVSRLRRRLEAIGASISIHTLRGIGYLLKAEPRN